MPSVDDFCSVLSQHAKSIAVKFDTVARSSVVELADRIIRQTPVDDTEDRDSYVARGDWTGQTSFPPGPVNRSDMSGATAKADIIKSVTSWYPSLGAKFYIVNHHKYIVKLEYGEYHFRNRVRTTDAGFSTQAPFGIVRINAGEWPFIVEEKARRIPK